MNGGGWYEWSPVQTANFYQQKYMRDAMIAGWHIIILIIILRGSHG